MSTEVSDVDTSSRNAGTKVSGLLGLTRRAGGVAPGTEAAREAIRAGKARLVVLAHDASPAQTAKVRRTLAGHPVPHVVWASRAELGAAIGTAPLSVVAVTHGRLAEQLLQELEPAVKLEVVNGAEV